MPHCTLSRWEDNASGLIAVENKNDKAIHSKLCGLSVQLVSHDSVSGVMKLYLICQTILMYEAN